MSLQAPARTITRGWVAAIVLAAFSAANTQAIAQSEQQDLVNAAETTLSNFTRDPDMTWLQQHLGDAKAVVIAPKIVKAGWIFGGAGGRYLTDELARGAAGTMPACELAEMHVAMLAAHRAGLQRITQGRTSAAPR